MKDFKKSLNEIVHEHRGVLAWMVALGILSLGLLIFSLVTLHPGASVVKVGYGDIGRYQGGEWASMSNSGGYHDGSWMEMLVFPVMALIFGVLHNMIAVKLYQKRGAGLTGLFLMVSTILVIGTIIVLIRLLGEG